MRLKKSILWSVAFATVFIFSACGSSSDESVEFNKPASYWYKKIASSIRTSNLDKADTYYISLKSEHVASPFLPTAVMMLAHAHMDEEEYKLANYYLDEYAKRYGDIQSREYIDFMKLQSSFLGIKNVYKDQKLIMDSIASAKKYGLRYPNSVYAPLVNTVLIRLYMSLYLLNENIAALYDRTGKHEAAKIYRDKNNNSLVKMNDITAPRQGMIGKIFD